MGFIQVDGERPETISIYYPSAHDTGALTVINETRISVII